MRQLSPRTAAFLPLRLGRFLKEEGRVAEPQEEDWAGCRSAWVATRMAGLLRAPISEEEIDEIVELPQAAMSLSLLDMLLDRDIGAIGPLIARFPSDAILAWARRTRVRPGVAGDTRLRALTLVAHVLGVRGELHAYPEAHEILKAGIELHTHSEPWGESVLTLLRHVPDVGGSDIDHILAHPSFQRFAHPVLRMELVHHDACSVPHAVEICLVGTQPLIRRMVIRSRPELAAVPAVQERLFREDIQDRDTLYTIFDSLPVAEVPAAWVRLVTVARGSGIARALSVLSPEALSAITVSEGQMVDALGEADAESRPALQGVLAAVRVAPDAPSVPLRTR